MRLVSLIFSTGLIVCASAPAWAHLPIMSDGSARDASSALVIADVDLSQVVYHEVTSESPQLWLAFDLSEGQSLYFQLGIPVIDRLTNYRPALALIGPGLPQANLPFGAPAGLGADIFASDAVVQPTRFDEPFSGTSSWILLTETIAAPTAGRYYLVVYDPANQPGKVWVAIGTREEFGPDEIAGLQEILPKVRAFHEVSSAAACMPCSVFPLALTATMLYSWRAVRRRVRARTTPN